MPEGVSRAFDIKEDVAVTLCIDLLRYDQVIVFGEYFDCAVGRARSANVYLSAVDSGASQSAYN